MSNKLVMPLHAINKVQEMVKQYGASNMLEAIAIFYDNRAAKSPLGEAWSKIDQETAAKIRDCKAIK